MTVSDTGSGMSAKELADNSSPNSKKSHRPRAHCLARNVRTIGWIVRNRSMDDVALGVAEVPKAGIVLATWDRDRLGAA